MVDEEGCDLRTVEPTIPQMLVTIHHKQSAIEVSGRRLALTNTSSLGDCTKLQNTFGIRYVSDGREEEGNVVVDVEGIEHVRRFELSWIIGVEERRYIFKESLSAIGGEKRWEGSSAG